MRKEVGTPTRMVPDAGSYPFVPVEGTGVYEIPVGPVHAGLIEPGHFRFWVIGETIMRMKARLWFVHKGIEKLFEGKTIQQGMTIAERVSGDSAVGHGLAYCLCIEDALGIEVDEQSGMIRSMLLELERLYNHVGDIGALCNEVGYGIALARALTLRESLLRLNHSIAGHRLLRGGVVPGGVRLARFPTIGELGAVELALEELVELVFAQSTVRERFTGTAVLTEDAARELGVVGLVARASSLPCDARVSNPFAKLPGCFDSVRGNGGDVMARLQVRVEEARISLKMVFESTGIQLASSQTEVERYQNTKESASGTGIVEAWRGAAVHRVEIARGGILTRLKIVDPSFFNWPALPVSLSETIVPDFPLANKSFNLSYAGNDLEAWRPIRRTTRQNRRILCLLPSIR